MALSPEPPAIKLQPDFYISAHAIQLGQNIHALDLLQGSSPGEAFQERQFLDLGCGTGDFTRDHLLPRCSPCRRMVAADVSLEMIEFARKHFPHPKICYDLLDISASEVTGFVLKYGQFDRVFSFFCLHWIKDQKTAMTNVAALMKPGGDCLLLFNAYTRVTLLRRKLARMDHWKKYAKECERSVPPTVDLVGKGKDALMSYVQDLLRSADLTPITCDVWPWPSENDTLDKTIEKKMGYCLLSTLVTEEDRPVLIQDVTEYVKEAMAQKEAGCLTPEGEIFFVHACKP
ncbi:juvenile hormone acid O-methyltransferase-like [Ixodes scapularis]|uniref:juvenile hormone acid O-methyltransferase-like n=1 Tax=Ixodes scapularis TaxID=6945 RepID=UPI001A9EAD02|nr:juvenile hormone acid O-methyltransferase-like [Ixodes scapularis]